MSNFYQISISLITFYLLLQNALVFSYSLLSYGGHVPTEELHSLVKRGVFGPLDFSDFSACLDCIRGKLTKLRKFESERSTDLLQLINTDICGPFLIPYQER